MAVEEIKFADAESSYHDSDFVIFGAPYDGTVSHRAGTGKAPVAIRKESYNFETYLYEYDIELENISIHDAGNIISTQNSQEALDKIYTFTKKAATAGKFPIMLGGEHSLSAGAVKGLIAARTEEEVPPLGVVVLDAHLDFRQEYESKKYSHACVTRRLSELVGINKVIPIGVRSMSGEEHRDVQDARLRYYNMDTISEMGMKILLDDVKEILATPRIYLSIDMDVIDPAFAPGVGNPEPFGLQPEKVKECIEILAPNLVGFDIMEVSPPFDNGNTSALAARFVRNVIGLNAKHNK
jgi:agmatinase